MSSEPTVHIQYGEWDLQVDINKAGKPVLILPGKIKLTFKRSRFPAFAERVAHLALLIREEDDKLSK